MTKSPSHNSVVYCPVCSGECDPEGAIPGWGEWARCRQCTLLFANPLSLGRDAGAMFEDAYQGRIQENGMMDFNRRVEQRRVILSELQDPSLWFWTPAFARVLDWLKGRLERGSTVLELGCGLGFFLHALRQAGFNAVGLDVAETVVELNRADGFPVWHGPVETLPAGWVRPDAIVSFFMLHHLDHPARFLNTLYEYAPAAPVALAAYGPTNSGTAASLPPRTLIRWNSAALGCALGRAGYQPTIYDIDSTGAERNLLRSLRQSLARTMALPPVYQLGKRLESRVLRSLPARARRDAYVVLGFGEPARGKVLE